MRMFPSIFLAAIAVAAVVFLCWRILSPGVGEPEAAPTGEAPEAVARLEEPPASGAAVRAEPRKKRAGREEAVGGESWESGSVTVQRADGKEEGDAREEAVLEAAATMGGLAMDWNPPPVSADTLSFVREAFEKWRKSGRDEAATADLRLSLAGKMSREETLAAAAALMKAGTEQDRMDALWMVSNEFGAAPGEEALVEVNIPTNGDSEGEVAWTEEDERAAKETHDVVALVGAGLEDPSADVRQVAYEAVAALSQERSDVLYSQLLCSDLPVSADLRRQLMEELEGADDPGAVTLFLQAMQSPDGETAAAAKRNLEAIAGQEFETVLQAAEWLEAKEQEESDADWVDEKDVKNEMNGEIPAGNTLEGGEEP